MVDSQIRRGGDLLGRRGMHSALSPLLAALAGSGTPIGQQPTQGNPFAQGAPPPADNPFMSAIAAALANAQSGPQITPGGGNPFTQGAPPMPSPPRQFEQQAQDGPLGANATLGWGSAPPMSYAQASAAGPHRPPDAHRRRTPTMHHRGY